MVSNSLIRLRISFIFIVTITLNVLCFYNACSCYLPFYPSADFTRTTFFYYELDKFYQNHRKYVGSRSDLQLRGDTT